MTLLEKSLLPKAAQFSSTRSATSPPPCNRNYCDWSRKNATERVGDAQTRACDVRILAATNRDLTAAVAAGKFREDLLYRLNVIEVTVPPLHSRRRDILPLATRLLQFFARQSGKAILGFTEESRKSRPGSVRLARKRA